MTPFEYVIVILVCMCLSAFFSGSEIALMRLDPGELEAEVQEGKSPAAVAARNLLRSMSRLLTTILLGNNLVNILGAVCASSLAVHYLGEKWGIIVSTVVMTILILLFSEILPKSIAARNPRRTTSLVALPLYLIHHSLFFVHIIVDKIIEPIARRVFGGEVERRDPEQELLRLSRHVKQHASDASPLSIIAGAAEAANRTVSEIMVPRAEIVAFPANSTVERLLDYLVEEGHTRVPIYTDSIDNITGVLHIKDLIKHFRMGKTDIHEIIKPVLRVPERREILPLLRDMQHTFAHMAIVKDEFGVTQGLVTQEDILEEIVGEIRDEFDHEELETLQQIRPDCYEAIGRLSVLDFNRETDWDVEAEPGDTLSGLVFNLLGRAPKRGDNVMWRNYKLSVTGMSGSQITRIRIQKLGDVVQPV